MKIGALFDLQADPTATTGPDWTTVYYSALVSRSQKHATKGRKAITYLNADGTRSEAIVPLEAYPAGEIEPFPTCVAPLPVNDAHIRASLEPPPPQPQAGEAPRAGDGGATPTSSSNTVKLVMRKSVGGATPILVQAPASPASAPPPQVEATSVRTPTPAPRAITPAPPAQVTPPAMGASLAAAAFAEAGTPSSFDSLGKRKRDETAMVDVAAPASPASAASSAPASPAKKSKKHKKDRTPTIVGAAAAARHDELASWHFDLPADPTTIPLGVKWTLDTLRQVIPALNSIETTGKATATNSDASSSAAPSDSTAAAAPSTSEETTASEEHPLMKSLELEFANWDNLCKTSSSIPAVGSSGPPPSSVAALLAASAPAPSASFLSYRSDMGQTHYYDQLKRITEKQLIAAPYVLDYMLGD